MSRMLPFRAALLALAIGLVGLTVFVGKVSAASSTQGATASGVLSPAEITALAAQLNADVNAAPAPLQAYAVIAKFLQTNIASHGAAYAGPIASIVIAAAPGLAARIRDVDLGDGLAHAAVSFGINSQISRSIAATVGREASRPVRGYFAEVTKALTGVTTLADIADGDAATVGDVPNGGANGLGFTITPNLPGSASCLNPSCTQL